MHAVALKIARINIINPASAIFRPGTLVVTRALEAYG